MTAPACPPPRARGIKGRFRQGAAEARALIGVTAQGCSVVYDPGMSLGKSRNDVFGYSRVRDDRCWPGGLRRHCKVAIFSRTGSQAVAQEGSRWIFQIVASIGSKHSAVGGGPLQRPLSCSTRRVYLDTPGTNFSGGRPALIHRSSLPSPQL